MRFLINILFIVLFQILLCLVQASITQIDTEPIEPDNSIHLTKAASSEAKITKPQYTDITISFAGDCTLGRDFKFTYTDSLPFQVEKHNGDLSYVFDHIQPIFAADDLTIVNLENTFTDSQIPSTKQFCFRGSPEYAKMLTLGSIEMVNIANNHTFDYLQTGFNDTLKALTDNNIKYSGQNYTASFETKGIKIVSLGYLGFTSFIKEKIKADIEKVKPAADIVIVSFHWGIEHTNDVTQIQTELGRYAIDSGADIVVGHHPHVIQGIEKYKGKYIVYSLGNFAFGGNKNPVDKDTFIFQSIFKINNETREIVNISGNIIPCSISSLKAVNNYQPTPLAGSEALRVLDRIKKYSASLSYDYFFKLDNSLRRMLENE